jgi:hypothetical protein
MGQITIYLDSESEAKARESAEIMNISLDKRIADLIIQETSAHWPESVKKLAGSWPDFPSPEERSPSVCPYPFRFGKRGDPHRPF